MHEWAQDMEANLSQESQNLLVEEYDRMQNEAFRRIDAVADEGEDNDSLEYFRFEIKGLFGIMDLLVQAAYAAGEYPLPPEEEPEESENPPELEDPEESEDPEEPDEIGEPEKTKEPEELSFASSSSSSASMD